MKQSNQLDWRILLWEDTPTTTPGAAGERDSAGGRAEVEDDDHHSRRRRERRIDPLHRPMQVRAYSSTDDAEVGATALRILHQRQTAARGQSSLSVFETGTT